ncbi:arginine N-succinyltransferase [Rhizorhabdus dicambivorans]|uniref:Arginine N-succinyltransferase n=1 Tax=Rhizorhabdus dicambivorans TaxID=1850238 RepID=A0A2A4G357_9SPHN|nr:arginine N-succinyltransferase [Rhizorhabdus dicambivorans]ATE67305.1 arginine N-succinyltransferase [Rhizorhabdus dicambivorans]PCE44444.1 arginine N-succinyltransferase [Rhizorhabdus dicambivorans]
MLVVRPAGPSDLGSLMELAVLSGRGFTSLPEDETTLLDRLTLSEASFTGAIAPREAWYTLMLEDMETGRIEGLCGVRAAVGVSRPHFSFRVMTLAQFSSAIGTRFDHQALVLVNECAGWTEVGSLYLRPERRSGGAGSLLARSRYMLIGVDRPRFSETVMAELRGYFSPDGTCPFWEGVASKFFRLPFDEADHMVMSTDGQFILDLAPRHPIYVELIPDAAHQAIGKVHVEGEAARAMLENEGFRGSGLVDIFDGGPTYSVPRDSITTIQRTVALPCAAGDPGDAPELLVSTASVDGFRAVRAKVRFEDGRAMIGAAAIEALRVAPGEMVRVRQ